MALLFNILSRLVLIFLPRSKQKPKSDWLCSLQPKMEKLYTVNKNKTRSWLWLRPWTPYCQIQTEIEKVGETTRPFRYDLNQIPYDYTVEVRNRFKGLHLIDRVPDELWMEVRDIVQETKRTQGFSVSKNGAFPRNQCRGWEQMGKRRPRDVK